MGAEWDCSSPAASRCIISDSKLTLARMNQNLINASCVGVSIESELSSVRVVESLIPGLEAAARDCGSDGTDCSARMMWSSFLTSPAASCSFTIVFPIKVLARLLVRHADRDVEIYD